MIGIKTSGSIIVVMAALALPGMAEDDVVVVTVQGQGLSPEHAQNDALRKALEQGGKTKSSRAARSRTSN